MFPLRFSASTHARPQARTHLHADIYSPINMSGTYIYIRYFFNGRKELITKCILSSSNQRLPPFLNASLAFLFPPFVHRPLPPICHLKISQTITSAGVLCAFRHLSNGDNDGRDRHTMRQKDSMNGFPQKRNYDSAFITSLQLGHVDIRPHCVHRFALSLPEYELHILLTLLNHVHLPSRRCL